MAKIEMIGAAEIELSLSELAKLPDEIQKSMIDAGADVLQKKVRKNAETMLRGPYYKGDVARSVVKKAPKKTGNGVSQIVGFQGTIRDKYHKKGTPAAEIAGTNEYGKRGQPARPFISRAIAEAGDEITKAEEKVYEEYLKSKNL